VTPDAGVPASPHVWCVVLAGGVGSRFWPASTPARPKQLLPLASSRPLVRDTIERILPLVPQERLRILTGRELAGPLLAALPELGPGNLLQEPRPAGTGPALAWAAAEIERRDPEAVMVSLHSDHVIHPEEAFRSLIGRAAVLAEGHRRLFTVGAPPTRPETGYGYLRLGEPLPSLEGDAHPEAGHAVEEFVEKPDRPTAEAYLVDGRFLWNTGIFVWRVSELLDGLERHSPELRELIPLVREGAVEEFFRLAPTISIDEALLERSDRVSAVRATFAWDDVGSWEALPRTRGTDPAGNVVLGDGWAVDCRDTVLYAESGAVVAFGVSDLVVVRTGPVTFVTHRDRTPDLKKLLERLPEHLRTL
jgi:mannose-1-phosphate guanylyltransferase